MSLLYCGSDCEPTSEFCCLGWSGIVPSIGIKELRLLSDEDDAFFPAVFTALKSFLILLTVKGDAFANASSVRKKGQKLEPYRHFYFVVDLQVV